MDEHVLATSVGLNKSIAIRRKKGPASVHSG
jgi:hypothetical protein